MNDLIAEAVAAERERCARVAERMAFQRCARVAERMAFQRSQLLAGMPPGMQALARLRCEEDLEVAAAIRKPPVPS